MEGPPVFHSQSEFCRTALSVALQLLIVYLCNNSSTRGSHWNPDQAQAFKNSTLGSEAKPKPAEKMLVSLFGAVFVVCDIVRQRVLF